MDGSYGSGSLLERIVIGGGGGPANTVGRFRNCCYNTNKRWIDSPFFNTGRKFSSLNIIICF